MCGITGFIGNSKNINLSFELLTKLFELSEERGTDAAGFWATESGVNGSVVYHKEPVCSSQFVKNNLWRDLTNKNIDLIIAHARGASKGVGEPFFNENNHPFTSSDKTVALAHNGRIEDYEYNEIKKMYEVNTTCDSEVLLRIFEVNSEKSNDLNAIKEIFSLVNSGHMAVSIAKRCPGGKRSLYLFRNEHRPLWICDLREELGQIFFVSEPSIWERACNSYENRIYSKCYRLIEINSQEVWSLNLLEKEIEVEKYLVEKEEYFMQNEEKYFQIPRNKPYFNLITKLDENDQIIKDNLIWNEVNIKELDQCINFTINKLKNIQSEVKYMLDEEMLDKDQFEKIIYNLKEKEKEITYILTKLYS